MNRCLHDTHTHTHTHTQTIEYTHRHMHVYTRTTHGCVLYRHTPLILSPIKPTNCTHTHTHTHTSSLCASQLVRQWSAAASLSLPFDVTFLLLAAKEKLQKYSQALLLKQIRAAFRALAETLECSGGGRTKPLSGQIDPLSSLASPPRSLVTVATSNKQQPQRACFHWKHLLV